MLGCNIREIILNLSYIRVDKLMAIRWVEVDIGNDAKQLFHYRISKTGACVYSKAICSMVVMMYVGSVSF